MSLFRKPQEQKKSAKEQKAQAGKRALAKEKKSLFSIWKHDSEDKKKLQPRTSDEKETKEDKIQENLKAPAQERFGSASEVIIRPRVTEKSTNIASTSNAYAFDVLPGASKQQIAAGIEELYGVKVAKIHTAPIPRKRVQSRRGIRGVKGGGKKAYVYLKKGDTIEFV